MVNHSTLIPGLKYSPYPLTKKMAKIITINGSQVSGRDGMTILQVAQENSIDIPTLCYCPELPPIGACRICVVEVEGSRTLVASCHNILFGWDLRGCLLLSRLA